MTPTASGSGRAVRQTPAYTSQGQGSVERFHGTLTGRVRAPKLQLENKYNTRLASKHPIMPWMLKYGAYLLNRYAVHAAGNTSYYRRRNTEHKTPICEFGEAVLYMLPTAKQRPKMEARFFPAIWLGKDASTGENNKIVKTGEAWEVQRPDAGRHQLYTNDGAISAKLRAIANTAKRCGEGTTSDSRNMQKCNLSDGERTTPDSTTSIFTGSSAASPLQTHPWRQHHQHSSTTNTNSIANIRTCSGRRQY